MEVNDILEALGNESRRKILDLLSRKPCYVSEISYYLGMAPKVVLEHLEKLERVGIVSCFEEGRRRYYFIDKSIRLEVVISPHKFTASITTESGHDLFELFKNIRDELRAIEELKHNSISEIYRALKISEDLQKRFSAMQSILATKFNQFVERMLNEFEKILIDDFERLVMLGLAKGLANPIEIAEYFRLPYREVERALNSLKDRGLVKKEFRNGEYVWIIK
ncbi:ArsR family transcriptional regulator [Archaeoglobales archaeon]|nr:MAG: ArsR family transcriptional regulator [Archaeoglobales archaeon ex4484_92]RLI82818.1 MAG: ArsR family transcriptional regulator [Archaeoglobales archaeon]